ncbi:hypothetical protein [Allobaculum mucilyticum]|uniref:hypothetical protein n=1 Tax=Allobaculum mucilyticum TaxID=2834459 RepID=UPI001E426B55|nr:hypothetical protein [Allobaculum mucilyticum]UNT97092.1 hypothetical protein KWG62_04900 [Allobaculum mucilyticum]
MNDDNRNNSVNDKPEDVKLDLRKPENDQPPVPPSSPLDTQEANSHGAQSTDLSLPFRRPDSQEPTEAIPDPESKKSRKSWKDALKKPGKAGKEPADSGSSPAAPYPQKPKGQGKAGLVEKIDRILTNRKVGWTLLICTLVFGASTCSYCSSGSSTSETISDLRSEVQSLENKNEEQSERLRDKIRENKSLQNELDEIKNGPDAALREVRNAFEAGEYDKVKTLYADLHTKYNGMEQDQEAKKLADQADAELEKAAEAKRQEEEAKKKAAEEEARRKAEEEARGYETGITYEQLARTPDDFVAQKVKFTGKAVQVLYEDDIAVIRLAVDSDYDHMLYCMFDPSITPSRILEDDIITVYGASTGMYSYTSVLNATISIPSVLVDKIDQ